MPYNPRGRRCLLFYLRQGIGGWGPPREYRLAYARASTRRERPREERPLRRYPR